MQRYFYLDDGTSLYRESYPTSERRFAYCWPFAEAFHATLDLFALDRTTYDGEVNDRLSGLARYWVGTPARPGYDSYPPLDGGGDQYFDDNLVIAQALVQLHQMRSDSLARAAEIFHFVTTRGDARSWPDRPGGIFWVDTTGNRDRGTYCSAAGARLGRRLAALGQTDQDYLGWAHRLQAWVDAHLCDASDGLYADKIRAATAASTLRAGATTREPPSAPTPCGTGSPGRQPISSTPSASQMQVSPIMASAIASLRSPRSSTPSSFATYSCLPP
jgi:hypothetical protein